MDIETFISFMEPVAIRNAGRGMCISNDCSQEELIEHVNNQNLDTMTVLSFFTDRGIETALNKIPKEELSGVAIVAAAKIGVKENWVEESKQQLPRPEINLPEHLGGTILKEYKVLSQRDNWFTGNFSSERVEEVLNHLAQEGWRVITITTVSAQMTIAGNRQDVLIFLERDRA